MTDVRLKTNIFGKPDLRLNRIKASVKSNPDLSRFTVSIKTPQINYTLN